MSKQSELLVACMLGNRWRATSAPAAAATCVAVSPTPQDARSRVHLENLSYSITNGGGNITVGVQVRGAGNTVYSTLNQVLQNTSYHVVSIAGMGFPHPKKGTPLNVFMNTVLASVVQTVNIAGWIDDTNA